MTPSGIDLKTLKLPTEINTGKVKTMTNTFKNCALLTLDCSGWATTSLTDITGFNEGAPGVISPVLNNF